jgi:hypothetical protein
MEKEGNMSSKDKHFKGTNGRIYNESTPWWSERKHPPEGAPNILFIVLDDVGFAQLGCYGSDITTPTSDDYQSPFRFTGILKRVVVTVEGEGYYDPELEFRVAMAKQ